VSEGPRLLERPEYCPAAYSLHAYCKYENASHGFNEFPHEPEGCETYGEALSALRSYGWIMHRDGTATCPKCARALGLGKFSPSLESPQP
jgi:hypothetical protein